jgi:hypothetical protein
MMIDAKNYYLLWYDGCTKGLSGQFAGIDVPGVGCNSGDGLPVSLFSRRHETRYLPRKRLFGTGVEPTGNGGVAGHLNYFSMRFEVPSGALFGGAIDDRIVDIGKIAHKGDPHPATLQGAHYHVKHQAWPIWQ